MIAETGIHPDKAFGRLQKITYKEKKTFWFKTYPLNIHRHLLLAIW